LIRKAELKDVPQVVSLVKDFFKESLSDYGLLLEDKTIIETLEHYAKNLIAFVAEENGKIVGVVGGLIAHSIFDKSQLIGQETIWYVDKDYRNGTIGLKLIKTFEDECKNRGASLIAMVNMGNLNNEILGKLYRHRGYKLMEKQYIKRS